MSTKTLLQINVTANWGSHGKIADDIGRLTINNGWKSYLAYGRNCRESDNILIKIGSELSVMEHVLESRLLDNHGKASRYATLKLLNKIKEIQPDVIHLHNIHGYYLNYHILFDYLSDVNIPVVWTLHDCWPFTGHCAHYDYAGCTRWKTGCHPPCPCSNDYPKSLLKDRSRQNWNDKKKYFCSLKRLVIVTVSNWLKEQVKESFLRDYEINVINNGVDVHKYRPADDTKELRIRYSLDNRKVLLGVANVWTENKGITDYIKLSNLLPDDYKIVMIGLSEQQRKAIPDNILSLPRTATQEELVSWYSCANVVLNLSYQETFGMTTVEGFACGTPGIVYNKTASPELASDGICEVVEAGDVSRVAEIIRSGKFDKEMISNACREHAVLNYDKNRSYKKYLDLYESLIR